MTKKSREISKRGRENERERKDMGMLDMRGRREGERGGGRQARRKAGEERRERMHS